MYSMVALSPAGDSDVNGQRLSDATEWTRQTSATGSFHQSN